MKITQLQRPGLTLAAEGCQLEAAFVDSERRVVVKPWAVGVVIVVVKGGQSW